ncbi:MAG: hypothetical protein AAB817_00675, partial [Patescibacteria group bacterium]
LGLTGAFLVLLGASILTGCTPAFAVDSVDGMGQTVPDAATPLTNPFGAKHILGAIAGLMMIVGVLGALLPGEKTRRFLYLTLGGQLLLLAVFFFGCATPAAAALIEGDESDQIDDGSVPPTEAIDLIALSTAEDPNSDLKTALGVIGLLIALLGVVPRAFMLRLHPWGFVLMAVGLMVAAICFLPACASPAYASDFADYQQLAATGDPVSGLRTAFGLVGVVAMLVGLIGVIRIKYYGDKLLRHCCFLLGGILLAVASFPACATTPPPAAKIEAPAPPVGRQNCAMANVPKFEAQVKTAEDSFTKVKEKAAALEKQILEVANPALEAKIADLQGQLAALPQPTPDLDEHGKPRNKEELDTYRVAKSTFERDIAGARLQIALNLKSIRDIWAKRDELYVQLEAAKKNLAEENECLKRKAEEMAAATNQKSGEAAKAPPLK